MRFEKTRRYFAAGGSRLPVYAVCMGLTQLYFLTFAFFRYGGSGLMACGYGEVSGGIFSFGTAVFALLCQAVGQTAYYVLHCVLSAALFCLLFDAVRRVVLQDPPQGGQLTCADVFALLLCAAPVFALWRTRLILNTLHILVMLLTALSVRLTLARRRLGCVICACCFCEFLYPAYFLTYFPPVALLLYYGAAQAQTPQKKQKKSVRKKDGTRALLIAVSLVFVLLLLLTPTLNKALRHTNLYAANALDFIFGSDCMKTAVGSVPDYELYVRSALYLLAALPVVLSDFFFLKTWAAHAKQPKTAAAVVRVSAAVSFGGLLLAAVFVKTIGFWVPAVLFSQMMLFAGVCLTGEDGVPAAMRAADERLPQKKTTGVLLIFVVFVIACHAFSTELSEMMMRMFA